VYAGDIKMNVCRYRITDGYDNEMKLIGSHGLHYRNANKRRRKVPSVILLILLSLLLLSTTFNVCAGDDKVIRVDPLGTILDFNPCMTSFLSISLYILRNLFTFLSGSERVKIQFSSNDAHDDD
jgi:hypothetical protein